jgi:hypothetical protein
MPGGDTRQHSSKGIIDGNAVIELDEPVQTIELGFSELNDIRPTLGAADDCATGHEQHLGQIVFLIPVDTRVGNAGQIGQ